MVYFNLYGRLGNILFQYATALSRGDGEPVGVTDDARTLAAVRSYGSLFKGLEIVPKAPAGLEVFRQHKCDDLEIPCCHGRDVLLDGYFQSERYFDAPLVRSRFAIPEALRQRLTERYREALSRPEITSIHVRRGDYLTHAHCHPFVGEAYFRDCMARLPDCRDFLVCSDDLDWCKSHFARHFPDRRFFFSSETDPVADLYLCSLCQNHIMSNSSFSWWGAWLGGRAEKRMLAPSLWFGFALNRHGRLDWSSIYAKGMTVVRNRYSPGLYVKARYSQAKSLFAS